LDTKVAELAFTWSVELGEQDTAEVLGTDETAIVPVSGTKLELDKGGRLTPDGNS
jgi:hypothetical protein